MHCSVGHGSVHEDASHLSHVATCCHDNNWKWTTANKGGLNYCASLELRLPFARKDSPLLKSCSSVLFLPSLFAFHVLPYFLPFLPSSFLILLSPFLPLPSPSLFSSKFFPFPMLLFSSSFLSPSLSLYFLPLSPFFSMRPRHMVSRSCGTSLVSSASLAASDSMVS